MRKHSDKRFALMAGAGGIAVVVLAVWLLFPNGETEPGYLMHGQAFRDRSSDVMVQVEGQVVRTLTDSREGGMVQKFIIRTDEGFDVLVTHAYDADERIPLVTGDFITARGEYEWSETGGQLDWTTYDKPFSKRNGWVMLAGEKYD